MVRALEKTKILCIACTMVTNLLQGERCLGERLGKANLYSHVVCCELISIRVKERLRGLNVPDAGALVGSAWDRSLGHAQQRIRPMAAFCRYRTPEHELPQVPKLNKEVR